jgi:hypothetical protein
MSVSPDFRRLVAPRELRQPKAVAGLLVSL